MVKGTTQGTTQAVTIAFDASAAGLRFGDLSFSLAIDCAALVAGLGLCVETPWIEGLRIVFLLRMQGQLVFLCYQD